MIINTFELSSNGDFPFFTKGFSSSFDENNFEQKISKCFSFKDYEEPCYDELSVRSSSLQEKIKGLNERKNEKIQDSSSISKTENLNKKSIFKIESGNTEKEKINLEMNVDTNNINNTSEISVNIKKKYRLDYYKKHFKVKFSRWMTDYVNKLIEKCQFKKKIGKLSLPDSKSFTGNPKIRDNKAFLSFKVKDIFSYEDESKLKKEAKYQIQGKNKQKIKNIENEKYMKGNLESFEKLISFLNSNLENAYEKFYSKEKYFKTFSENELTKFYDTFFIIEKGYSLLKEKGFIKLCKGEN